MNEFGTVAVVDVDRLIPGRGVAALVAGRPIALFLVGDDLFAIDNVDPYSGASVMSRGIVGEFDGVVTVASPMYKQRFELATGRAIDGDASVGSYRAWCVDGVVRVSLSELT